MKLENFLIKIKATLLSKITEFIFRICQAINPKFRAKIFIKLACLFPSRLDGLTRLYEEVTEKKTRPFHYEPSNPPILDLGEFQDPPPNFNGKSIIFIRHCYYNFYYLAKALRAQGWDALCVSFESPNDPVNQFYHGEDLNFYSDEHTIYQANIYGVYELIKKRFKMVHFYGAGMASLFPEYWSREVQYIPWDFLEFKQLGIKLGYNQTGCQDLTSQSAFYKWSNKSCDKCIWKNQPSVCSDQMNLEWGWKLTQIADLVCIESDTMLDYKNTTKSFLAPLMLALDPNFWHPNLEIPEAFKIERQTDEYLVYHAVGNYQARTKTDGKNYKGSSYVFDAIEKLQQEGINVKLIFVQNVESKNVRFIQAQADVVVDQLNYGRYGANARESLMLGKPVIGNINLSSSRKNPIDQCLRETPIINATEENIYEVLKELLLNVEKRRAIGIASRTHALKWWSAENCANRFEIVYDSLLQGIPASKIKL